MAKVKEQVKYNPKWSEVKRLNRARMAVSGKSNTVLTIIMICCAVLITGVLVTDAIFYEDLFSDGFSGIASMSFSGMFFSFFIFALNSSLPSFIKLGRNLESKQNAMLGGCVNIYNTFAHMPVKKVSLYKQSFFYYIIMMVISLFPSVVSNIVIILKPEFRYAGGMVAVVTLYLLLFVIMLYCIIFGLQGSEKKNMDKIFTGLLIVFYIFWLLCMFGTFDKIVNFKPLCSFGGVPCLCIEIAGAAAIVAIEKLYVEKRAALEAWSFKEDKNA